MNVDCCFIKTHALLTKVIQDRHINFARAVIEFHGGTDKTSRVAQWPSTVISI